MAEFGWLSAEMKYRLKEEVGSGKITTVHKAIEVDTKKVLAVKIYNKLPLAAEDSKRRAAIRNEATMLDIVRNGVSTAIRDLSDETLPFSPYIPAKTLLGMSC